MNEENTLKDPLKKLRATFEKAETNILKAVAQAVNNIKTATEEQLAGVESAIVDVESEVGAYISSRLSAHADIEREDTEHQPDPDPIDLTHLPNGLTKYPTSKGWYIKCLDENREHIEELDRWVASVRTPEQQEKDESVGLLMWVQALPRRISKRLGDRDRSYSPKSRAGIYVNITEMKYIEMIASDQKVPVHEAAWNQGD